MLRCEGCPVHYRVLSNIPGLYPLHANSTTLRLSSDNLKCLQMLPNVWVGGRAELSQMRSTSLKVSRFKTNPLNWLNNKYLR